MFSNKYFGVRNCADHVLWPNTFRSFLILHYCITYGLSCFNLCTVPISEVPRWLLMPTTKKTWRQLVSAENNWWTLVRYQAIKTDVFGKKSGSAEPVYGYADPDTRVIIGCVFGIRTKRWFKSYYSSFSLSANDTSWTFWCTGTLFPHLFLH